MTSRQGHPHEAAPARLGQAEVARLYDRLAPVYDVWGRATESKARRRVLSLAAVRDGERVLEVAAGTGLAFRDVVASNPTGHNLAVDLSPGMLGRARRRLVRAGLSNYELAVASALELPAPDGAFDVVLNNYMFDLMDTGLWPQIVGEFRRVIAPSGRLVLANMTHGEGPGSRLYGRVYRRSPALLGGCRGVALSDCLEAHGFTVQSREYVQQCLFPSEVILARPRAG